MLYMGSWGVGIFSNDDAADLREDFRDLIAEGLDADQATRRLKEEYGVGKRGADDHDFWLALAAVQHKIGHVSPTVIRRALEIIDDPAEMDRWAPQDRGRRVATLAKLRTTLELTPPAPKRVRPRTTVDTRLEAGSHVVVPLHGGERRILLRITGIIEDRGGRYPRAVAVEWDGTERQLRKADRLPALLDPTPMRDDEAFGFTLLGEPVDPEDLRVLPAATDRRTPKRRWESMIVTKWSELGRFFDLMGIPKSP